MENPFHNFFKSFSSKGEQSVLGIDIGSASIKVVQVRKQKGQAVLETYGELSLGPYGGTDIGRSVKLKNEQIIEALKDVLKEANTSTKSCAISIPMKSSMVSVMKIPTLDESQLPKMIPIEARKYIPVPISEVALDWFIIPKISNDDEEDRSGKEGKTEFFEALVVAIHNNVLNDFNSIITGAELDTSFFEVEIFSTIRSVIDPRDNSPLMICDIGAGATKLYIVERGIVRDSHIINRGSQDITLNISKSLGLEVSFAEKLKRNFGKNTREQDEQIGQIIELVMSPIFSDANTVMLNYQKKNNKNIGKAILVGGGSMVKGLDEQAEKQFSIQVEKGIPFSRLEAPAFLQGVLENTGLAFSVAIGLALRKLQDLE